jgi:hypothetical protein
MKSYTARARAACQKSSWPDIELSACSKQVARLQSRRKPAREVCLNSRVLLLVCLFEALKAADGRFRRVAAHHWHSHCRPKYFQGIHECAKKRLA